MKIKMTRETKKLFKVKRKITPLTVLVPILLVVLLVCAVIYDNSRIVLDEVTFSMPTLPREMDGYTILQISDIRERKFGAQGESLDKALGDSQYDIVVLTGDLVAEDGDATGLYQALDYFAQRQVPVYFITGETDPPVTEIGPDGSFGRTEWAQTAMDKGAIYLDIPIALNDGERKLWLMPASTLVLDTETSLASLDARLLDDNLDDGTVQSILYRKGRYEAFADAMAQRQQNDLTLMLTHMPCLDASLQSESTTAIFSEADLILAGHHLGGQICLPVLGAIYAQNDLLPRGGWFPDDRYVSGLHGVNATYQYVSTGLGTMYGPPLNFRLCNPPQISRITLTRQVDA
ncbi:MAG: metallophosphoesterase [Candidatus Spyradocola sp.]